MAILDGPMGTKEQELFLQGLDIGDEKLALPAKLELTENENEVFITVTGRTFSSGQENGAGSRKECHVLKKDFYGKPGS